MQRKEPKPIILGEKGKKPKLVEYDAAVETILADALGGSIPPDLFNYLTSTFYLGIPASGDILPFEIGLKGPGGNQNVTGTDADEWLVLGDGFDDVNMGAGADIVQAGGNGDEVYGGDGNDLLLGEDGHDILYGEGGDDILLGGAGSDEFHGGSGSNYIDGGDNPAQADTYVMDAAGGANVNLTTGTADTSDGTDILVNVEWVEGNDFDNMITGDNGSNRIRAGDGNDTIYGGGGADGLVGEGGDDLIYGGNGPDSLSGDFGVAGAGNDTIYGEGGADAISGNAGINTIYAGNGPDEIRVDGTDEIHLDEAVQREDVVKLVTGTAEIHDFNSDAPLGINGSGSGDLLDFSSLTGLVSDGTNLFVDYFDFRQDGVDTIIGIDVDGTANGQNFVDMVALVDFDITSDPSVLDDNIDTGWLVLA